MSLYKFENVVEDITANNTTVEERLLSCLKSLNHKETNEFNRLRHEINFHSNKMYLAGDSIVNITHRLKNTFRKIEFNGFSDHDINELNSLKTEKQKLLDIVTQSTESVEKNRKLFNELFSGYLEQK